MVQGNEHIFCANEIQATIIYRINSDNCELQTHNSTEKFCCWHKLQMWSLGGLWCSITGAQKRNWFQCKLHDPKFMWYFSFVCSTHDPHCLSHLKVSLYIFLLYWGYEGSHVHSLSFSCWLIDRNNNSFCFQATANLYSSYCWNGFRTVFFKCLKTDGPSVSLDSFTLCLRNTSSLICAWFYGI